LREVSKVQKTEQIFGIRKVDVYVVIDLVEPWKLYLTVLPQLFCSRVA
jgi:hypothetical protein